MADKIADCILVSVDFSRGIENGVLIVGRKAKRKDVEIINALQGQEALDLYNKLVTRKEKKQESEE